MRILHDIEIDKHEKANRVVLGDYAKTVAVMFLLFVIGCGAAYGVGYWWGFWERTAESQATENR